MPESPELDQLAVELPAPPDVPIREGEKAMLAGMNLEDRRRKEQLLEETKALLKRLEGTSAGEMALRFARSPSARDRQIKMRKQVDRLLKQTFYRKDVGRWEGPSAPATIINMNPVELHLLGELQRWTVPSAKAGKVNFDDNFRTKELGEVLNLKFRGRTFPASYTTFTKAHVWLKHTGTQSDSMAGVDTPAMDTDWIPPLGLAHQFYSHYVEGAADAQHMGGIIMFEGDIHTLNEDRLKKMAGKIWVPKAEITLEGLGDLVYTVEEMSLLECVGKALDQQRRYADAIITEGHNFATSNSNIERNQLSNYHRIWHNFALEIGYLDKPYSWATERLRSDLLKSARCPDCGTAQNDPEQYFCTNCNSPFDALKAFLAGKTVSPDRLAMYEGAEWEAILAETKRRKSKIAMLELPEETKGRKKAE